MPDGLAAIARFDRKIAEQTSVARIVAADVFDVCVDVLAQAKHRRQFVIAERFPQVAAGAREIQLDHFESKGFLGCKVIGERPVRNACGLHDVAHARTVEAMFMHDPKALVNQGIFV